MLTLALDTATALLSIAVGQNGAVLALETSAERRGQSEDLLPMVQKVCATAGVDLEAVGRIVAITGPGSFTGLRIGLAAAKGLAFGLNIPLIGISAFRAAQFAVPEATGVVLESWRDELYVQFGQAEPEMLTAAEIAQRLQPTTILTGDAAAKVVGAQVRPMPPLAIAALGMANEAAQNPEPIAPYYVRPPDISQPKAK